MTKVKSIWLLLPLLLWGLTSLAQCPPDDTTVYRTSVKEIYEDINTMYTEMDTLNNQVFFQLMKRFDATVSDDYNDLAANDTLRTFIYSKTSYLDSVRRLLDSQYILVMIDSAGHNRSLQSCFLYRMHKEIRDFQNSIELLIKSMKRLVVSNNYISVITNIRFQNTYYYMSVSRSLLLARMNNLENELVLFRPYAPYPRDRNFLLTDTNSLLIRKPPGNLAFQYRDQDKISTATDAMITAAKHGPRNWLLKETAGGAAGGLIAYAIISLFKGRK